MILDERNEFADAASVAAAAGTALIGDVIDVGDIGADIGLSSDLYFVITVDTEIVTGGTAGTIKFQLVSDAQAAIAVDGSATVHLSTGDLVTDDSAANSNLLNAGARLFAGKLPSGSYERYLGVICTIGTTTVTAGKINAFLTPTLGPSRVYPEGAN
jgi:hypothetical protein